MKPYYITTAIDYTNAAPHIGHAYEKILADVMTRYQRRLGNAVFFLTGVDQHGQKVQKSAEAKGLDPQVFVDQITSSFTELWQQLEVNYDGWAATTHPLHKKVVRAILQKLHDQGQLYKQSYKGYYSLRQEQFITEKERNADGSWPEEWGEVTELEEENWYFKLSQHIPWLKQFLKSHPDFITPAFRAQDVINALENSAAADLCISRPIERLSWGIPLPFDERFVNYVWFDALTNYLSFAGYLAEECENKDLPNFNELWHPQAQVIGKDILIPAHAIYWTTILHALGFSDDQMPKLIVHGWWNIKGSKMSKTLGNIVNPKTIAENLGTDALRFYLMRDIATGYDADFQEERLYMSYNKELGGGMGNLLNRSINMAIKYRDNTLPSFTYDDPMNQELRQTTAQARSDYLTHMNEWNFHLAIQSIWKIISAANAFVDSSKPFSLAKDPQQQDRLNSILYHLAESILHASILLEPICPTAMQKVWQQLQWSPPAGFTLSQIQWGILPANHKLSTPTPIFPRIDPPAPVESNI
jgi:methionyl-tRNA synthetase